MTFRLRLLTFIATLLVVEGAVSARDAGGVSPMPQSTPEIVVGRGGGSGFSTKRLDAETGPVYFGLRYYNPATGRWPSREPLGEAESLNLYSYCHNDAINRFDALAGRISRYDTNVAGMTPCGYARQRMQAACGATAQAFTRQGENLAKAQAVSKGVEYTADGVMILAGGAALTMATREVIVKQGVRQALIFLGKQAAITGALVGAGHCMHEAGRNAGFSETQLMLVDRGVQLFILARLAKLQPVAAKTTVYRVEGLPNTRITIGEGGQVAVQGDQMLFLNFGDKARAEAFLAQRMGQGMPGAQMKSFEVPSSFLDDLRSAAVPESMAKQFPGRPLVVDPTKAADQFGLRPDQIKVLQDAIIQGSGRAN